MPAGSFRPDQRGGVLRDGIGPGLLIVTCQRIRTTGAALVQQQHIAMRRQPPQASRQLGPDFGRGLPRATGQHRHHIGSRSLGIGTDHGQAQA